MRCVLIASSVPCPSGTTDHRDRDWSELKVSGGVSIDRALIRNIVQWTHLASISESVSTNILGSDIAMLTTLTQHRHQADYTGIAKLSGGR